MVYTDFPVTVDGVSLDDYGWNVDSSIRPWPGARGSNLVVPGVDGVVASLNDDLEPITWVLSMWVIGADSNGVIPSGAQAIAQVRANFDALSFLFSRRDSLLDVREVVDHLGTVRQAYCKVEEPVTPDVVAGLSATFRVPLLVPAGVRQDVSSADWSQANPTSGNAYEVTTLQGSTGPINDAILLVKGPATNPRITDTNTGAYVQLNQALSASQFWRVNCDTWATRYGTGLTLGSADTTGTSGQGITFEGGGNARFLRMKPALSGGVRRVHLSLTGSGFTAATTLSVRARRKWLQ